MSREVRGTAPETAPGCIVMAVYRPDPALFRVQIRSLKEQTMKTWRCVVAIDGAANADIAMVLEAIGDDERFEVTEFRERVGHFYQFERALALVPADCTWIAMCDQDDEWFPEKLASLVPELAEASAVQCEAFSMRGSVLSHVTRRTGVSLMALLMSNRLTGSFAVVRRSVVDTALPFPVATASAYHDHWLAVCAAQDGGIVTVRRPLQYYVQHNSNVIGEAVEGPRARLERLRSQAQSASPWRLLDWLAQDRWAWRVRMARALFARAPGRGESLRTIELIDQGRLSSALMLRMLAEIVRGDAPLGRGVALVVGAAWASRKGW